jgi:6-phosphogluconolactonase (cycloisomerase 2 family)
MEMVDILLVRISISPSPSYAAHTDLIHSQISTLSTFKLPFSSSSTPQQTFVLTMSGKGTVPSRQDAPHPHETIVDPTGAFILVPDLGADLIRIYSIDSSGNLTACTSYVETPGTGPRHGAFSTDGKVFYVGNELANTVNAFSVAYANGCISLTKFQTLTTLAGNTTAPTGTKVGEVHIKENFLYASNRRDLSFSPNDSIASFSLDSSGSMTFIDIISSGGTYPRTFDIATAGDFMVIGDQTTANVVVVKRDPTTGQLGPQLASMRIGTVGTAESDNGLSAVLWDQ